MSEDVITVDTDVAFEILIGDCLRQEPFPGEIQVIGRAHGWAERMAERAKRRGWKFTFDIVDAEGEAT